MFQSCQAFSFGVIYADISNKKHYLIGEIAGGRHIKTRLKKTDRTKDLSTLLLADHTAGGMVEIDCPEIVPASFHIVL